MRKASWESVVTRCGAAGILSAQAELADLIGKRVRVTVEELPEEKSLGQVAAEWMGHDAPWDELSGQTRVAWQTVAMAVINEYERRKAPGR